MMNSNYKIAIFSLLVFLCVGCNKAGPYNSSANAKEDIINAQEAAKLAHQPLVIIFGANWCSDCQALSKALETGEFAAKIAAEFKVVKVNVGNFDTNLDIAESYGNPIQGGIPGAAVLSEDQKILYVTKPGELATVRQGNKASLYHFLKKVSQ